ncbi:hypothetical protein BKA67DRAFT_572136, partial [Truncatella angustata]
MAFSSILSVFMLTNGDAVALYCRLSNKLSADSCLNRMSHRSIIGSLPRSPAISGAEIFRSSMLQVTSLMFPFLS